MNWHRGRWAGLFLLAALVLVYPLPAPGTPALPAPSCHPLKVIADAWALTHPRAAIVVWTGAKARAYLRALNAIPPVTDYQADGLITITTGRMTTLLLLRNGTWCGRRLEAGNRTHLRALKSMALTERAI